MPADWRLMGVVCGLWAVDPNIEGGRMMRLGAGPDRERVGGRGDSPEEAMRELTGPRGVQPLMAGWRRPHLPFRGA